MTVAVKLNKMVLWCTPCKAFTVHTLNTDEQYVCGNHQIKERPILFSADMVRAILSGRKTMTRRVIAHQPPHWTWNHVSFDERCINIASDDDKDDYYVICPYGKPGERIWVREGFAKYPDGFVYKADFEDGFGQEIVNMKTGKTYPLVWKPSIFMPRIACRIMLEIVAIRVERIQEIDNRGAWEEGIPEYDNWHFASAVSRNPERSAKGYGPEARDQFAYRWDTLNAKRGFGWDKNPYVWAISFKRIS